MGTCMACRGTGKVRAMSPAKGNTPYVETVTVLCGVCGGSGKLGAAEAEAETEKLLSSVDAKRPLQKPARATTLKKINTSDEAPAE